MVFQTILSGSLKYVVGNPLKFKIFTLISDRENGG